jgi:predicted nucleotidyltransferase
MPASQSFRRYRSEIWQISAQYDLKGKYDLRVFGSVARGEDTEESDMNFLADVNSDLRAYLLALIEMNNELEDLRVFR